MKDLIDKITARPSYKNHTVLDGGHAVILVTTTSNLWFLYSEGNWQEISSARAEQLCNLYYLGYRYKEMVDHE